MKKVKVIVEKNFKEGYYWLTTKEAVSETFLNGYGITLKEAKEDLQSAYEELKEINKHEGKETEDVTFKYEYTPSCLLCNATISLLTTSLLFLIIYIVNYILKCFMNVDFTYGIDAILIVWLIAYAVAQYFDIRRYKRLLEHSMNALFDEEEDNNNQNK